MSVVRDQLRAGLQHEIVLVEGLTRTQIVMYAGASGDFNPLHTDETFARDVAGYRSVFSHGMLTMGMCGRGLVAWLGDNAVVRRFGGRFLKQVWPGDSLTATYVIREATRCDQVIVLDISISTKNGNGEEVFLATATAEVSC